MERNGNYDVVVVGGGCAGVTAAVGAVKAGASTLLIERNSYLGGEATNAGITAFCGFYSCGGNPVRVVEGVGSEVLEEMDKIGPTYEHIVSVSGNHNFNFDSEYLKIALDNLMEDENVDFLLHTVLTGAKVEDGKIVSIQCSDDEGSFTIAAKNFVDATGDANLVHLAGGETGWGDEEGNPMVATLTFRLSNVDTSRDLTPAAVEKAVKKGKEAGLPYMTREKGFILKRAGSNIVSVLLPSMQPEGMTGADLTEMERNGRKQVLSYVKALTTYLPGMEDAQLAVIGPSLGFRETRRMIGRDTITTEDVLERRKRSDGVARGGWKPEIHKSLVQLGTYIEVKDGSWFDIPLGALQSKTIGNLFGAGRIVSSDPTAYAAVRVMGTCFATGHAAGAAAACQARDGVADAETIRAELVKQNALI